jgi:membrane protease YdiL (CAAX protease family)
MARKIVAVFGTIVLIVGLLFVAMPASLESMARAFLNPVGVVFAGGLRIGIGIVLWLAADSARTPRTFKVLGVLFVLGGIGVFAIGLPGLTSLVDWGTSQGHGFMRAAGAVAAAAGAFLTWSATAREAAE